MALFVEHTAHASIDSFNLMMAANDSVTVAAVSDSQCEQLSPHKPCPIASENSPFLAFPQREGGNEARKGGVLAGFLGFCKKGMGAVERRVAPHPEEEQKRSYAGEWSPGSRAPEPISSGPSPPGEGKMGSPGSEPRPPLQSAQARGGVPGLRAAGREVTSPDMVSRGVFSQEPGDNLPKSPSNSHVHQMKSIEIILSKSSSESEDQLETASETSSTSSVDSGTFLGNFTLCRMISAESDPRGGELVLYGQDGPPSAAGQSHVPTNTQYGLQWSSTKCAHGIFP